VLNPSGVRFGSAEVYNVLDARFPDEIQDSVCVGQRRPEDEDERVLLFLLMKPGAKFTEELVGRVKSAIAQDVGRRCVPKYVFETPEIPVSQKSISRTSVRTFLLTLHAIDNDQPQEG
jgi:acetoacetyl-CoA synthetase